MSSGDNNSPGGSSRPQAVSRNSTNNASGRNNHAPANPSGLRNVVDPSEDASATNNNGDAGPSEPRSPTRNAASETTSLLRGVHDDHHPHEGQCNHGTFSPRPSSPTSILSSEPSFATSESSTSRLFENFLGTITGNSNDPDWRRKLARRIRSKKMHTSQELAREHGIRDSPLMYLSYYIPCINWMSQYKRSYLKGDLIAAVTIAGMYLPMALSLADNLAHVPPINGLYGFVFQPFVYALLGSSPQMMVGPEAAGSLLVGSVVKSTLDRTSGTPSSMGGGAENDAELQAKVCGIVGGIAAATVFIAGLTRLGFLDSVLSRPFLRGFISAIGVVIGVDQLIPELGLNKLAAATPAVGHGSSMDKLRFMFDNLDQVHKMTALVAGVSFTVIMVARETKRRLQPRYPGVAYVPDRFIVVVLSAWLAYYFEWEKHGVQILGTVKAASGRPFTFRWPFQPSHVVQIRDAMGTSFLLAMLGFFESSVAAKSLGDQTIFPDIQLSPNRELIALGAANLLGSCFMSLPAFGGYGRSKVNRQTGGKTPMSSLFVSFIALMVILFGLRLFYYLPKPVLSSLISVVAWSLIEECPHDIYFFLRIRAWQELSLMFLIVLTTIFFSLNMGIAIGIGISLLLVIRNSTRPHIQILGRIPGTNRFENAEAHPERLEFVEGCLIVKIPEPLTFANTGQLKNRLRRLELYGTNKAHPALPRLRAQVQNKNVVFDVHGVTSMDGSGTQVLEEIVRGYRDRGVRVFFSRLPSRDSSPVWKLMENSGIVEMVGGIDHFVDDVHEALRLTEGPDSGDLPAAS
ncbi:hypothetical protein MCOR27_009024 [Pyricularia oryzae]|uniref:STAS domain-containing protein n=2 Tax=Pyricularia TaxID=48558 RepID=A0ABQ8NAP3_PYRGI|nr:hypothetical protein MCOR01_003689 [Pyricularia oryzae]KAI6294066.1 hypothetical protein MCOR33_008733 [Pyricularia grisea]KAH9431985.1 hypothetical protein MCOR02_006690 [Pyricularia oryzae]KAI6262392.1 hypothetical protein MCOR19_001429 [Pyricularia oryzae]KAI6267823.1 hypothetical protein MCOR26_009503 [Pyricularia oryzae]